MYGIFTYIWLIFMVNVAKYTIHGSYANWIMNHHESPRIGVRKGRVDLRRFHHLYIVIRFLYE